MLLGHFYIRWRFNWLKAAVEHQLSKNMDRTVPLAMIPQAIMNHGLIRLDNETHLIVFSWLNLGFCVEFSGAGGGGQVGLGEQDKGEQELGIPQALIWSSISNGWHLERFESLRAREIIEDSGGSVA